MYHVRYELYQNLFRVVFRRTGYEMSVLSSSLAVRPVEGITKKVSDRRPVINPVQNITSWEQYHQVFEAIVRSNGWDNDTAALQLFSHLQPQRVSQN